MDIAPDIKAAIDAVREDPLAIGFIPATWVAENVKELGLIGGNFPQVPVVLLARQVPDEAQLTWLYCLGDRILP